MHLLLLCPKLLGRLCGVEMQGCHLATGERLIRLVERLEGGNGEAGIALCSNRILFLTEREAADVAAKPEQHSMAENFELSGAHRIVWTREREARTSHLKARISHLVWGASVG